MFWAGKRNRHQMIFRKVLPNHIHIESIDQKINFYDSDETEINLSQHFRMYFAVFAFTFFIHAHGHG